MSCFIGFHSKFAAVAKKLNRDIMAENIVTTLVSEALPFDEILDEVVERLGNCTVMICILSHGFEESRWLRKMVLYARDKKKVLLPVRVETGYVVRHLGQLLNGVLVRDASTDAGYQAVLSEVIETVKVLLPEAGARSGMGRPGRDGAAPS